MPLSSQWRYLLLQSRHYPHSSWPPCLSSSPNQRQILCAKGLLIPVLLYLFLDVTPPGTPPPPPGEPAGTLERDSEDLSSLMTRYHHIHPTTSRSPLYSFLFLNSRQSSSLTLHHPKFTTTSRKRSTGDTDLERRTGYDLKKGLAGWCRLRVHGTKS